MADALLSALGLSPSSAPWPQDTRAGLQNVGTVAAGGQHTSLRQEGSSFGVQAPLTQAVVDSSAGEGVIVFFLHFSQGEGH